MPLALQHIRRMRGGAQSQLMRCSDGGYYVVKFQNNPQHPRVLVNELLGTRLAARMGLLVPPVAPVEVRTELIASTPDLFIELGSGKAPCVSGMQFGSRYPYDPATQTVHDFLPDHKLVEIENLGDFAGMLVFDKWTCNTNGRQAVFFVEEGRSRYKAWMIDQGFCFNAGEWSFPDAPLRGLYARGCVYEPITGWETFEPWISRVEGMLTGEVLDGLLKEIPPEWYDFEVDAFARLADQLDRRRSRVRELILDAKHCYRLPFPNWR